MAIARNLSGLIFEKLTVIKRVGTYTDRSAMWECLCACGNTTVVTSTRLRNGSTKSCGCIRVEFRKIAKITHGMTGTLTYKSWISMWERCTNIKHKSYPYYGGRGITVCERWKSFENFLYDMGTRSKDESLDRIKSTGNYEPNNCRWILIEMQSQNRVMYPVETKRYGTRALIK